MELKKKDLLEIIDGNGELIGNDDIPKVDANADTQAKNTTDYNQKVGQQPFRYDMLGRFGFTLMPFMEGVDKNESQAELENDLIDLMNEKHINIISYYKQNPKKIISDYRKHVTDEEISDDVMKQNVEWVNKIIKIIEKHFEKSLKNLDEQFVENIAENKVVEDKMVDKVKDAMLTKTDDNALKGKRLGQIAGLINKLDKKDIDDLIDLIERKNG